MEIKEFYKGKLLTGDFEKNAMEFVIDGDFVLKAGNYYIISDEALQNFTNKICERQRYICASDSRMKAGRNNIANAIINSPKPKIEDILNN